MTNIQDIIVYFIEKATNDHKIDGVDLISIIYLADWHCCVKHDRRLTNIHWNISQISLDDNYEVEDFVRKTKDYFETTNGSDIIILKQNKFLYAIDEEDKIILDKIIELYTKEDFNFFTFLFSTYPFLSAESENRSEVDILEKSRIYKQKQR